MCQRLATPTRTPFVPPFSHSSVCLKAAVSWEVFDELCFLLMRPGVGDRICR